MSLYKHIRNVWKQPRKSIPDLWQTRLIKWREEPVTIRIERPTRLDKARSLGYKAKQGFVLVRQRVIRGGRMREKVSGGRRPKHSRRRLVLDMNYQTVAEQRANKLFKNCEVLGSYWVGEDSQHKWYEIILVDPMHPQIVADDHLNWLINKKGRVYRGLTTSARKTRGFSSRGFGAEHIRPSRHADLLRRKKL